MYRIIDIRTETALLGGLRFPSFDSAWSYLDYLHKITGKICWYAEAI